MMGSRRYPRTLALFQKRVEGDDALLRLAGLRFRQAGLGTELYAATPGELEALWAFRPVPDDPAIVHLDRSINLLDEQSRRLIADFASHFRGRLVGLVIHDQDEMAFQKRAYFQAAQKVASQLETTPDAPRLLIEYAAGMEFDSYVDFFHLSRGIECISACIDIGHVGIRQTRSFYSRKHSGEDVCGLTPNDPRVPGLVHDVQEAVQSSLHRVLGLIEALAALGKPLHFHLHDGHPLSTLSPYGVSDHLSFLTQIPIPFEHDHKWSLNPMYGPSGLLKIVQKSMEVMDPNSMSFTLEIHPINGRLPLQDGSYLFEHWQNKNNAEQMNYWLSVLLENCQILLAAQEVGLGGSRQSVF